MFPARTLQFIFHVSLILSWNLISGFGFIVEPYEASLVAQAVKNLSAMQETWVKSWVWEDPLEKGMATHSNFLAWRIPWTEEPGRLQSIGSQKLDNTEHTHMQNKQTNKMGEHRLDSLGKYTRTNIFHYLRGFTLLNLE